MQNTEIALLSQDVQNTETALLSQDFCARYGNGLNKTSVQDMEITTFTRLL